MMQYSIGEVASLAGIPISTLRYYDREGLFPNLERSGGGIRRFTDKEIETLGIIECLKTSGLSIQEIKQFLDWCQEGDSSLQKRRELFYERLAVVTKQMEQLQKTMNTLRFKCWYYDTALSAGTEEVPKNLPPEEIPADILRYRHSGCLNNV
ncbi:MerR family transcriptional regulator [Faecalispora jeddahensis]|uniref:MerR family transcriptional regulator n=1 Tax=Faecalispora jeddahensis TaxID=1414721 RepID=UPI0018991D01|nr:MerR family transcriptional regulator [Faecalispora jeddahensis]